MAESAISSVLSTLGNLTITETKFLMGVPAQVESIKNELRSMQGFLRDADSKHIKGDNSAAILVQEITDAAYQAENVIAKINWMQRWNNRKKGCFGAISRYFHFYHGQLKMLHEVGKEIEKIKSKITDMFRRKEMYGKTNLGETSQGKDEIDPTEDEDLNMQRLVSPYFESKDDFFGFDNEKEKIIEDLTDPLNKDLTFVSLVGMGGIGKSTLAREVFTDPKIQESFNKFAWISVSQRYKSVAILKDIIIKTMNIKKENLRNKNEIKKNMNIKKKKLRNEGRNENEITEQELENMSEEKVKEKLHEFLKNKKYLIVLDDIWGDKALDRISSWNTVFPNSNNGSRMILTTRDLQVANHPNYAKRIHKLEAWYDKKGWEFLRNKAFSFRKEIDQSTLNELENLGEKLSKKCKGLPLALSVLGGYLSKNIDVNIWSRMVENLDWGETEGEKNVLEILALSFHDIQYNLKSCFLYLALFPEDLISASKLIKMWIAEGFIPRHDKRSQEETARKYLTVLAHQSMIQVVEMSKTHGWIKRIRIHDIWREFCIAESAKIGFLKICNNHGNLEASTSDGMTTYRAAFSKSFKNEVGVHMPNLRTLIGFDLTQPSFRGLNYLRVLELVGIPNINKLPDEIGRMIFLRYIGLRKCGRIKIPSSIKHLINLQTFDARYTAINSLPSSIWKIPTLRHVYMELFRDKMIVPKHDELQLVTLYLGLPVDFTVSKTREFIKTLEDKKEIFSLALFRLLLPLEALAMLSSHHNLQELTMAGRWPESSTPVASLPHNTPFPPNLRKLKLYKIYLSKDPMPTLELLPSLVVLELGTDAYNGERMSCSDGGFPRLQHMSIHWFVDLVEWKIEAGAMPRLSKLRIVACPKLKMQPEELVHLPALEELQLKGMPDFPKETCDKLKEIGRCKVIIKDV